MLGVIAQDIPVSNWVIFYAYTFRGRYRVYVIYFSEQYRAHISTTHNC